jgi:hypothetical protein
MSHPLLLPWIERIFERLSAFYGSKIADLWGTSDLGSVKAVWAEELAGYSGDEIAAGIAGCKTRDWPPTLPEFLKLCRPPIDPVVAYHEAIDGLAARREGDTGSWSHPAIFWAASKLSFELRSQTFASVQKRWEAALTAELSKLDWPPIPEPHKALAPPPPLSADESKGYVRAVEKAFDKRGFDDLA